MAPDHHGTTHYLGPHNVAAPSKTATPPILLYSSCPTKAYGTRARARTARARGAGASLLALLHAQHSSMSLSPPSSISAVRIVHTFDCANESSVVTGERKHAGLIRKYGLNMSRQAFREKAAEIGFVKVSFERERAGRRVLMGVSTVEHRVEGSRQRGKSV
ncbi:hypothetical protein OPT61_g6935 [Boeremia exigua]|uniref:Uncharacterized protein n=1 Tax=Boeremia exigua TaxID=749465 RepID=A0ACC2I583_9PLEO|nr:hypothetical protein OPT61_g6935 [Boeremia exigua]